MQLSEIMTREVEVVSPTATLQEAARKMRDSGVGSVPVCNGEQLVGMVTDRDIVIKAVADGQDAATVKVEQAMSPEVFYCFDDQSIEEAARTMADKQIRRLPIINRDKRLVGIVSLGDLSVEGSEPEAGAALEEISKPVH